MRNQAYCFCALLKFGVAAVIHYHYSVSLFTIWPNLSLNFRFHWRVDTVCRHFFKFNAFHRILIIIIFTYERTIQHPVRMGISNVLDDFNRELNSSQLRWNVMLLDLFESFSIFFFVFSFIIRYIDHQADARNTFLLNSKFWYVSIRLDSLKLLITLSFNFI